MTGLKSSRTYTLAGSLLLAGLAMLALSQVAGGSQSPAPTTSREAVSLHHTPAPSPDPSPKPTKEPTQEPTPEDTATPADTATPPPTPRPTNTKQPPAEEFAPTATSSPSPTPPPTQTPTLVREELPAHLPPKSGSGGLLARHKEKVAVLGFVLALLGAGLIVARGAVDARQA